VNPLQELFRCAWEITECVEYQRRTGRDDGARLGEMDQREEMADLVIQIATEKPRAITRGIPTAPQATALSYPEVSASSAPGRTGRLRLAR
jgi:hypothetical protein